MICEEEMVDLRIQDPKSAEEGKRLAQLAFRLNHTMPMTDEYQEILKELFGDNLGEGSYVTAPLLGVCFDRIKLGRNVIINSNMLAMARGGITIEDEEHVNLFNGLDKQSVLASDGTDLTEIVEKAVAWLREHSF